VIAQAENIHLNITQHFGFHLTQILQHSLDFRKYKILCQLADAVVKGLISVFEVQLNIPPVFPQSQQADGDIRVMRSHIPLHLGDAFLDRAFLDRSSCHTNFIEAVAISFYLKKIERIHQNPTKVCKGNQQISPPLIQAR